jgi:hypothetical protein
LEKLQPGKTIVLRNAAVEMLKPIQPKNQPVSTSVPSFIRMVVNKWGKIESRDQAAPWEVKTNNNLSSVEYELVTVYE